MSLETRRVLLVGGSPGLALALCRGLAGAGHRAALLRWNEKRSFADASRYCSSSIWLGAVDDGVSAWLERLSRLLQEGKFSDLWPADDLAYELACTERWQVPQGIRVIGPDAEAYARAADRCTAIEVARDCGLATLPSVHLPRNTPVVPADLPCIARPQRAATVVDDEPARFFAKTITNPRTLENKLRDDLPRVGMLLQAMPEGERLDMCLAAVDGDMKGLDLAPTPELAAIARSMAKRLGWTGLLQIECRRQRGTTSFVDLHCTPGALAAAPRSIRVASVRALLGLGASAPTASAWSDPLPTLVQLRGGALGIVEKLAMRVRELMWRSLGGVASPRTLHPSEAILFVCKGNINRSLVAEQVLRRSGFNRVASAGLLNMSGRRPSQAAERYIEEVLGLPAAALRSNSLRRAMARLERIDVVVCFERRHIVDLLRRRPELRGRVHLLATLAGQDDGPLDIEDPHGGSDDVHRHCFDRIGKLLGRATYAEASAGRFLPSTL